MTVTTLMVPLVLIATMLTVQLGLAYHARQVMSGAVQDGAADAARPDSSPAEGVGVTLDLIEAGAGSLLAHTVITSDVNGELVTVSASASVVRVLPLLPTFAVSASSSATLERFRPQVSP